MNEAITIVSGVPRSGTSLMMRMLAFGGHPVLVDSSRPADINNPRGYYEIDAVKNLEYDSTWLISCQGFACKMAYPLLYYLPPIYQYRVVLMRRNLLEVVNSQNEMLNNIGHCKDVHSNVADIASYYSYQLEHVSTWMHAQPNIEHLQIDYNALLSGGSIELQRLNAFFRDTLYLEQMRKAIDPTLYRTRQSG